MPATAEGRNCAVFHALRRWAYQPRNWELGWEGLLQTAKALNALHAVPLGERELGDIVKSVHGWMAKRQDRERRRADVADWRELGPDRRRTRGPDRGIEFSR